MDIDKTHYIVYDGRQFILKEKGANRDKSPDATLGYYTSIKGIVTAYLRRNIGRAIKNKEIKTLQDLYIKMNSIIIKLSKFYSNIKKISSENNTEECCLLYINDKKSTIIGGYSSSKSAHDNARRYIAKLSKKELKNVSGFTILTLKIDDNSSDKILSKISYDINGKKIDSKECKNDT